MEWTVVTAIVVLVGLFLSVGKPILGVVKELQELRFETNQQRKEIDRDIDSIKELSRIAQSHEERLKNQERETDKLAKSMNELVEISARRDEEMRKYYSQHRNRD